MAINAGVGLSKNLTNHRQAAYEAVSEAISKLEGRKPSIVFVFSSINYDQTEVVAGANKAAEGALVVGGSAAGEITSWATEFDAVNAMAVASDRVKFFAGYAEGVSKDSFKSGVGAAKAVLKEANGEKIGLFILLPDGMTGDGAGIVRGVQSVLGENFPIIGGSTGDDYLFKKTYEYCREKPLTDAVVGIGLSGAFAFGFGVRHGWEAVGLPLKVTKALGTVIQEIDGRPALKVYEEYFGKEAGDLIKEPLARMAYTYPLGMAVPGSDELLIRDPVIANEKGEITLAAEIPIGSTVRLMIGDREKAIAAAKWAAECAKEQLSDVKPRFILMFNCMARNKLLGVRCHEENNAVNSIIGADIPMVGFYTYGEQGPLLGKKGTPTYFHNETMTLVVIGE